jgi:myo-inositol 2-dehydrogenase/D-chiro-inositol 1-dehydrogenase
MRSSRCWGAMQSSTQALNDGFALISRDDVDAVVIASPDWTHAELAIACINVGKPVLCEKPLASSAAAAEAVLQAEVALGRRLLQVGFMREFDPIHRDAKALLDRGDIGRPVMFRGIHINPAIRGVRMIEDVIINSAIHDIHSTRWIMSREVESVFTQYTQAQPDQPESCRMLSVQMKLQHNALAVLEVNADSGYGYEVDIEITGETGTVRTDSIQGSIVKRPGSRAQHIDPDWLTRFDIAYIDEVQAWIDSIIDNQPIGPTVWDGYMSLVVAEACVNSARSGQPVAIQAVARPDLYASR